MKYRIRYSDGGDEIVDMEIDEIEEHAADQLRMDLEDENKTWWETIWYCPVDEDENEIGDEDCIDIAIDPIEPGCEEWHEHDWYSPHDIVGGLEENPGVFGHGGGVIIVEICRHCGCRRTTDTWAQRPDTGKQGLRSIQYETVDSIIERWGNEVL